MSACHSHIRPGATLCAGHLTAKEVAAALRSRNVDLTEAIVQKFIEGKGCSSALRCRILTMHTCLSVALILRVLCAMQLPMRTPTRQSSVMSLRLSSCTWRLQTSAARCARTHAVPIACPSFSCVYIHSSACKVLTEYHVLSPARPRSTHLNMYPHISTTSSPGMLIN
jgi:hypothetical protein